MPEEARLRDAAAAEAALVAHAKRDRAAFAPLYARYVGPVYRYCYRQLGSQEAAEDATSQTFTKALAGLHTCRDDDAFRPWLFAIARNVVTDSYRRRQPEARLEHAPERADHALGPEALAIAADERRSLHALLATLPESQQAVVQLRLSGLTHPEIAAVLGRSHTSVRTLQSRALARLRTILVPDPDAEEADR